MNTKYVLGAGISGLTYAYYNRDYRIISTDLGGKLNREYLVPDHKSFDMLKVSLCLGRDA